MSDVFISYAHIDDQPLTEGHKGWISQFHRSLEIRLSQLLGEKASIWRDPKLTGNDIFGDAIVKELPVAKVLLSILSPRYVHSEWCLREAREFCQAAEKSGGVRVGNKSRLFKVVKTPVPTAEIPPPLNQVFDAQLGFEFFQLDPETGRPHEFSEEFGPDAKRLFLERVYDLAYDLCELLKRIKEGLSGPRAPTLPGGKTVYLATTTSDLQGERDRIQRELRERGHTVVPDAPLPTVAGEAEQAVRAFLGGSQLAVHLIGNRYGLIPEDGDCSIVELQNRLAAERVAAGSFSRIIWMPKDVQPQDERQKAFVRLLFEDAAAQRGAELLKDSVEKLKGLILDRLTPPAQPETPPPPARPEGPSRVYLMCDQPDEAAADPLEDYLFAQGLEVSRLQFDGTEAEVSAAHRQHLQACDGALIYYGAGSRGWVDIKLLDLLQAPGYGRTKPFRAKAVCVAPPEDRNKQRFRTHTADVIRLAEPFSPEPLGPFVQLLKGQPAPGT